MDKVCYFVSSFRRKETGEFFQSKRSQVKPSQNEHYQTANNIAKQQGIPTRRKRLTKLQILTNIRSLGKWAILVTELQQIRVE
jgi:hypothetical protein